MNSRKVILRSSARLHFNSLKMNQIGGRGCGGVGLAVDNLFLEIEFSFCDKIVVIGGNDYLQNKACHFANSIIKYLKLSSGVKINIKKSFKTHVGLGSGTQLGLCIGRGIALLYKKKISLKKIAFVTNRAGVSGIGYYSFMYGGLIVDGGYKMGPNEEKKTFGDHASCPPMLIGRYKFPKRWKILLIIPTSISLNNEIDESSLFISNTPVPLSEVEAICTNTLMGLIPGLLDKNYFEFIDNLLDIVRFGTKKIELELNKKALMKIMNLLKNQLIFKWKRLGNCKYVLISDEQKPPLMMMEDNLNPAKRYEVRNSFMSGNDSFKDKVPFLGMSSLGPTMYSILSEDYHDIDLIIKKIKESLGVNWDVRIENVRNEPHSYYIE